MQLENKKIGIHLIFAAVMLLLSLPFSSAEDISEFPSGKSPDFDSNGIVGLSDFFMFADYFGKNVTIENRKFDINSDDKINFDDFFAFADWFGKTIDNPINIDKQSQFSTEVLGNIINRTLKVNSNDLFILGVSSNNKIDWKTPLAVSTVSRASPILLVENGNRVIPVEPSAIGLEYNPYAGLFESPEIIDDFSSKLFIDSYKPKQILFKNYNSSVLKKYNLPLINLTTSINSYLYNYSNLVVIGNGNSYESSIIAASFAAFYNLPLFFAPLSAEDSALIGSWNPLKIAINVTFRADYNLTVSDSINLIKRESDYLVITTSDDLNKLKRPRFSLSAPIISGGRKGVLLNVVSPTKESVRKKILEITKDGFSPDYIVVVGSELNLPFIEYETVPFGTLYNQDDEFQYQVNLYYWADYKTDSQYVPDSSVGAITGYSVTDASTLIARSLFYDRLSKTDKVLYWHPYNDPAETQQWDPALDNNYSQKRISNFHEYSTHSQESDVIKHLNSTSVFIYDGHASRKALGGLSITEFPVLNNPTFIFAFGCAALEPWAKEEDYGKKIITYEAVRNGAVGIFGAVEVWLVSGELYYGSSFRRLVESSFKMPVGDGSYLSDRLGDSYELYTSGGLVEGNDKYYKKYVYLLGDPKLVFKTNNRFQTNVFSDNISINFKKDSWQEKFVCFYDGGCALCKIDEKECNIDEIKKYAQKYNTFYFPILLDSYVYSVYPSINQNPYRINNQMSLSFFTTNKVSNAKAFSNDKQMTIWREYYGNYCFSFKKQQYCPNQLDLYYGSSVLNEDREVWEQIEEFPQSDILIDLEFDKSS